MKEWSKKRLELFVVLSIVTTAILATLKAIVFINYRAGALLLLISGFLKTLMSYCNSRRFDFSTRHVLLVAGLGFVGTYLGVVSYYCGTSSTSYVISSNLQHLFIALMSIVWRNSEYCFTQYFGLLMTMTGFLMELSFADSPSDVPLHTLISIASGMFNAASLVVFETKIKPTLSTFRHFWDYMTAYGVYLTVFSSFCMAEEALSGRQRYLEMLQSPVIYSVVLFEVLATYILSRVSLFLDCVERSTLFNVSTGLSAVVSDLHLSHEIDVQRFLGFSFAVIGTQFFNFFGKK